jgi:heme-degrading monooxygenase HmoA
LRAKAANAEGGPVVDAQPSIMLIVRGLKSELSPAEFERRYKERMPQFRAVTGLVQKYYSYDESTGEWAGIYLWDSEESVAGYLESDLRKSIASAYELKDPPRVESFRIVDVLRAPRAAVDRDGG